MCQSRIARARAFSLIELMIGIVILGLGLVMVATIFPVAWDRARSLSELTLSENIAQTAEATVTAVARVPGPLNTELDASGNLVTLKGNVISFAGDLIYDPKRNEVYAHKAGSLVAWPNDTWVHELNLENLAVNVVPRKFIGEDPWQIEQIENPPVLTDPSVAASLPAEILSSSYLYPQMSFQQRIYPPLRSRNNVDTKGEFTGRDDPWDDELDNVRYCWSVLHRLRDRVPTFNDPLPPTPVGPAKSAYYSDYAVRSRLVDLYLVTLRRPQPTFRYAKQDPASAPDPYTLDPSQVKIPTALDSSQDLLLPVPWRVQIEILKNPPLRSRDDTSFGNQPTGIPTEARVPPTGASDTLDQDIMYVDLFSVGTTFVDEVTGQVFRVNNRRLTSPDGDQAILTLDREILVEDIDLPDGDPRCDKCETVQTKVRTGKGWVPDDAELFRTVWVYPPPVEPGQRNKSDPLVFAGNQPVVDISVNTVTISPTR